MEGKGASVESAGHLSSALADAFDLGISSGPIFAPTGSASYDALLNSAFAADSPLDEEDPDNAYLSFVEMDAPMQQQQQLHKTTPTKSGKWEHNNATHSLARQHNHDLANIEGPPSSPPLCDDATPYMMENRDSVDPALLMTSHFTASRGGLTNSTMGASTTAAFDAATASELDSVYFGAQTGDPSHGALYSAYVGKDSSYDHMGQPVRKYSTLSSDVKYALPSKNAGLASHHIMPSPAYAMPGPFSSTTGQSLSSYSQQQQQPRNAPRDVPHVRQYESPAQQTSPFSALPYEYLSMGDMSLSVHSQQNTQHQHQQQSYSHAMHPIQHYPHNVPDQSPQLPSSQLSQKTTRRLAKDKKSHPDELHQYSSPDAGYNLGFIRECLDLMELYREFLGTSSPLHPSVLDENNVRYVVATSAGAAERSNLTCGVYLAMALGAWHAGNKRLSNECQNRGHAILSQLISDNNGLNDYSSAMNLAGYARYATMFLMDDLKGWNYYQLAMNICRNISALNSDIYCRCLFYMNGHERATAEDLESFRLEISRVRQLPYYLFPALPSSCKQGYPWMRSPQNASLQKELFIVCSNIANAFRICRSSLARCATDTERSLITPHMMEVLSLLERCKLQVERAFEDARVHNDPPPHSPVVTFAVFYLAMKAEIYHQLRMETPALQWAMEFVHYLQENAIYSGYYLVMAPIYIEAVLQIFWAQHKMDILRSFIDFLNTFQGLTPLLARSVAHYTQLLSGNMNNSGHATNISPTAATSTTTYQIPNPTTKRKRLSPHQKAMARKEAQRNSDSIAKGAHPIPTSGDATLVARKLTDEEVDKGIIFIGEGVTKRARKRRRRQKEIGEIWGANASRHSVLSECRSYMSVFRKHLWHFAPLHPAVLDESNIQYFVLGDGSREVTSLSLSVLLALSRGAVATGNLKAASEFFKRAEQQMDALLRTPGATQDYSLALAAGNMVWLYPILQDEKAVEKGRYYASTSLSICEGLGACNSDAYSRALMALCMVAELPLLLADLPPSPSMGPRVMSIPGYPELALSNNIQESEQESIVEGKFVRMQQTPYYAINSITPTIFTVSPLSYADEDMDPLEVKKNCRSFAGLQLQMPVSTRNLNTLNHVFGMLADVLGCLKVYRARKDVAGLARVSESIAELRRVVKDYKLEQRQACDEWPDSSYRLFRLFFVVSDAVCSICRGLPAAAEPCVLKFLAMAAKPVYENLQVGVHLLLQAIVGVIWAIDKPHLLIRAVHTIDRRTATPQLNSLRACCLSMLDRWGVPFEPESTTSTTTTTTTS